jgi:predicted secreted hydrolase
MKKALVCCLLCLLTFVLAACSVPGVPATVATLPVVGAAPSPTPLPSIRFPQDEAPHSDLTEWWYYTGHLSAVASDGQHHQYGFELVFFQLLRSNLPPYYAAQFAISDLTNGQFHYDQRLQIEPNAIIPNGTSTAGFHVSLGNWSAQGLNGHDDLQAVMDNYTLNLDLHALTPPVLHNGTGLISLGAGGSSYYYSRPLMAVTGTLLDHQQTLQVTGNAWMDHQWGNFLALGGGGWDWFSIQLNNQSEMMVYVIRNASGQISSLYGDYLNTEGKVTQLPSNTLSVKALNHWISPLTAINYPSGWQIRVNDPHLQLSLTLQPELKNQELVALQSTGNIYWEGAVGIQGQEAGHAVQGQGYVELTGYHK